eukprot:4284297-Heterocapsa_arctica.AAC.1
MAEILALMAEPGRYVVQGPMCRWHMKAADGQGEGFVRKETLWMTSSKEIADVLKGMCANFTGGPMHRHVHLIGGGRAAAAAEYPISL